MPTAPRGCATNSLNRVAAYCMVARQRHQPTVDRSETDALCHRQSRPDGRSSRAVRPSRRRSPIAQRTTWCPAEKRHRNRSRAAAGRAAAQVAAPNMTVNTTSVITVDNERSRAAFAYSGSRVSRATLANGRNRLRAAVIDGSAASATTAAKQANPTSRNRPPLQVHERINSCARQLMSAISTRA